MAAVAGLGWFLWTRHQASLNKGEAMITATVTRGDLIETVSATGSVTAQAKLQSAQATAAVNEALLSSAQQNIQLVQQKDANDPEDAGRGDSAPRQFWHSS